MQRRIFLSILAIAFAAIFIANTGQAAAQQNPYCCGYTIDVINLPAACFPLTIVTDWGPGFQQAFTVAGNGQYVDMIPNCPPFPALTFDSVILQPSPTCTQALTWTVNTSCCVQIIIT